MRAWLRGPWLRGADRGLLPYQIVMGVTTGSIGGIIVVLGPLRDEQGFSDTEIGIVVAGGFLAAFAAQVALAPYADRGHGRAMAVAGMALGAAALGAMAVLDGIAAWTASRAALGFSAGLVLPGLRRAASVMNPAKAGENLGRLMVGEVLGFVAGPVISAVMVTVGGLRAPFVAFAAGMALFLPVVARLPADRGLTDARRRSSLDLLGRPRLQGALIMILGYFVVVGAFEAVLPVMFQDRGGDPIHTSIAFTVLALPIAAVGPRAGRLADRLGPARMAAAGMGVVAVLTATYGFWPGLAAPIAVMALVGVADGFGATAGQVAVARAVPEQRQAGAMGLMGAVEVLGAGVAAIPAAVAYDLWGERPAWAATGAASLVLIFAGWLRMRDPGPATADGRPPAGAGQPPTHPGEPSDDAGQPPARPGEPSEDAGQSSTRRMGSPMS